MLFLCSKGIFKRARKIHFKTTFKITFLRLFCIFEVIFSLVRSISENTVWPEIFTIQSLLFLVLLSAFRYMIFSANISGWIHFASHYIVLIATLRLPLVLFTILLEFFAYKKERFASSFLLLGIGFLEASKKATLSFKSPSPKPHLNRTRSVFALPNYRVTGKCYTTVIFFSGMTLKTQSIKKIKRGMHPPIFGPLWAPSILI